MPKERLIGRLRTIVWLIMACCAMPVLAFHPPVPTVATIVVREDRQVSIDIFHDALAFALNDTSARVGDAPMRALLNGPPSELAAACEDARKRILVGLRLKADGVVLPVTVQEMLSPESVAAWSKEHPDQRLPCKMDMVLRATLPPDAASATIQFPEIFGEIVVVIERPGIEPVDFPLAASEVSPPFDVRRSQAPSASAQAPDRNDVGTLGTLWRYITFGFRHIIPEGADHALFVFGLFLLSPRWKPVLGQITSFTIAHTLTLTLTTLHIVGVPSSVVEPVIAASIALIGIENLLTAKVHRWRLVVAFLFGLMHGMGVATAFNEVGFPAGQLVPSLAAFTVGVEGGHILVLLVAFLLLGWTRDKPWYRARVALPLSLAISMIAIFWTVQRVMVMFQP